jgi:peptidoglycan/xylan/chitin deacetylase (PgdA/CDA1 family)
MTKAKAFVSFLKHPSNTRFIIPLSIVFLSIIMLFNLGSYILQPSYSEIVSYGNNGTAHSSCNCVVFRMDDIQDYWIRSAQLAIMNQSLAKNQSLTLGIIMNALGNDSEIVNKIKQGNSSSGPFELAVHGWNHTNYINLTEDEQRISLEDAHNKMINLFGNASEIFIPPYDAFNNDTLNAMRQVDMKIIDGNRSSIDQLQLKSNSSSNTTTNESALSQSSPLESKTIFYIPSTISFKDYYGGKYLRNSDQSILNNVTQSISANGYAVVVIHPQDFVQIAPNGSLTPTIDQNEINDFSRLLDLMSSNHIPLGSFSEIIAVQMQSNNTQKYPIH